jgi:hypothetical protein
LGKTDGGEAAVGVKIKQETTLIPDKHQPKVRGLGRLVY